MMTTKLQWGHGDEAVEESTSQAAWAGVRGASMGPRRRSRGRVARIDARLRDESKLQWGHGDEAVEEVTIAFRVGWSATASMGPRR